MSCRQHLTTAWRLPESSQRVPGDKLILWNKNILESPAFPFRSPGTWSKILLTSHSTGCNYQISNTNEKNCAARQRANSSSNSGEMTPSLSPQEAVCPCPCPQHQVLQNWPALARLCSRCEWMLWPCCASCGTEQPVSIQHIHQPHSFPQHLWPDQ